MSPPHWYSDLPENMTEAAYRALPEDVARSIEVVHGHVIRCESPTPEHNRVARRLANSLESERPADPCLIVETDIDVVLWRVPRFTFRRPDIVVYRCLDEPGRKPEAQHVVMVVEVSSPSTGSEDLTDKKIQYAAAGIPLYLVVRMDEKYQVAEVHEFHLDAATGEYRRHQRHRPVLELEHPIGMTLPLSDLTRP